MNWHLEVPISNYPFEISHKDTLVSVGSCFAQHIAEQMSHYKFHCLSNPYGTLFHPLPILQNLTRAIKGLEFDEALYLHREETVFHFNCHSSIWADSESDLKNKLIDVQTGVLEHLKASKVLILTFGSAFLYQLKSGDLVANCHKQPQSNFTKSLSKVNEIKNAFQSFHTELKELNQEIQIILTVSPVRHVREGLHENNLSKSTLLLACDEIKNGFEDVHYFPAYELMIDELRDYRFYENDKVHPSSEAIAYVWEKFSRTLLSKGSTSLIKSLDQLFSALNHKPFRPNSAAHQQFLQRTLELAKSLSHQVDLEEEIKELKKHLQ